MDRKCYVFILSVTLSISQSEAADWLFTSPLLWLNKMVGTVFSQIVILD